MSSLWHRITHYGVEKDTNDWDQRNLRLMNGMAVALLTSMAIFQVLNLTIAGGELVYHLIGAKIAILMHFVLIKRAPLNVSKVFFCIIPLILISMFGILGVGAGGWDKFYLLVSAVLPLIIFKDPKYYLPLSIAAIVCFYGLWYFQQITVPTMHLPENMMTLYRGINIAMIFTFLVLLISMFKKEISGYQGQIEEQKEIVEEKNREITESITYAKRIQEAILPHDGGFETYLPENYVLYIPKDIVAGDFYWLDKSMGKVFFAAADCTGHGVPGAMVSVVCHGALNRSVREFKLTEPSKILDKTREIVVDTFSQSNKEVKDGMDIGICAYDHSQRKLEFSGSNNGLYLIRNGELSEIKPDKQPVGLSENPTPFTNHSIDILPGDTVHLFTDGFADQFGGPKGKKFKYKPFKEMLVELSKLPMEDQKKEITKVFENWRGDFEQVDDICMIGIKF